LSHEGRGQLSQLSLRFLRRDIRCGAGRRGGSAMPWMEWYNSLAKPSWTPAPSTISLIWTILYPIILVSFGFVFVQVFRGKIGWKVVLPFALNLVANLSFMPVFAGLRNVPLAALDIVIVWTTIIWMVLAVWPAYKWVAVAQVPYFVWVSIATILQVSITAMNWGNP
jgi:benzodiazapine receptor